MFDYYIKIEKEEDEIQKRLTSFPAFKNLNAQVLRKHTQECLAAALTRELSGIAAHMLHETSESSPTGQTIELLKEIDPTRHITLSHLPPYDNASALVSVVKNDLIDTHRLYYSTVRNHRSRCVGKNLSL